MNKGSHADKDASREYMRRLSKQPPLFLKSFNYEDIMEFLSIGVEERFLKEEVVIVEDEKVNSAYLLAEGRVAIFKDNIQLAVLKEGDILGETFLFSQHVRMAEVVSKGESILLRFDRATTLNFFKTKPEKLFHIFTRNIIEIQRKKIGDMNDQLLQLKSRLLSDPNEE